MESSVLNQGISHTSLVLDNTCALWVPPHFGSQNIYFFSTHIYFIQVICTKLNKIVSICTFFTTITVQENAPISISSMVELL